MSQLAQIKKPAFIVKSVARVLTLLVLLCVYLSSLPLSQAAARRSSDEVFCPLQKMWVKKNSAAPWQGDQKQPLKNICARVERKDIFLSELTESLRFTRATPSYRETEKLFFTYLAKGKPSLTQYFYSQNAPEPQYISSARIEKNANNTRFEFAAHAAQAYTSRSQPHVFRVLVNNLSSRAFTELKNISRDLKPRAPPFSA
ncbi:MAG TPA: hypothetical protein VGO50_20995 [Pyrinomonadaceae bacterium]|jgi:hypothetical protein|nr:hypothetical protein [Pyrinomonadaceae bacterium]